MSRIIIVDKDLQSHSKLKLALNEHDSAYEILSFNSLSSLDDGAKNSGKSFAEFYNVSLVLLDYSLVKHTEWISKLFELKKKLSPQTPICFLAFENEITSYKSLKNLNIFNVLYRPYDPLILKESLYIALNIGKKIKPLEITPQEPQAFVGFLKELEIVSISELGFVSRNNQKLNPGSICNYFSPLFENGKKQSVYAKCLNCWEEKNNSGFYLGSFHFVGLDLSLLKLLRSYLHQNKDQKSKNMAWFLEPTDHVRQVTFALIDSNLEKSSHLKDDILAHYKNIEIDIFDTSISLMKRDPMLKDKKYDCVINLNLLMSFEDVKSWIQNANQYLLISNEAISSEKSASLLIDYVDYFFEPLDSSYFYKKLKILNPDLIPMENFNLNNITTSAKIKAAQVIKVTEMCELYLNFEYHRELALGSFREFAFIHEDENDIIEMPAFSGFTEKIVPAEKNQSESYLHQFVFWGTTDHYLKQIRLWLLNSYISKQQK